MCLFFRFHREYYNKAPLFWLRKNFILEVKSCKDIYNFYSQYLNVVDDYFVEFVHSLARKSTNSSDTPVKIREKLFSLFASRERQANFRAAFPLRNTVFSRLQLPLFFKIASIASCATFQFNCKYSWLSSPLAQKIGTKARPLTVKFSSLVRRHTHEVRAYTS